MPPRNINKHATAIIMKVGGTAEFARWYGITASLADHWRKGFPAHSYLELSRRLSAEKRIVADVAAWNMRRAKKRPAGTKTKRPPKAAPTRGAASASA